ncbi:MAG TPA: carboxyl transferase domain-containing protein, partial [Candidatus Dormibacteraeota bacterium]|nr:carboxyl transferase domain-containing protein [Candidatus Dormibacteraeota bacterium]
GEAKADAVWVGWGFVAEDADFAELCEKHRLVFIGPPAKAMRALGDKIAAKRLAEACGLPVGQWSGEAVSDLEDALRHARRIGYPLLVKATAGGGGRGVRLVVAEDELGPALESARSEAAVAFGDPAVFLEQYLPRARHVEVQVVCDAYGTGWALGVRDCSVQRRYQKLIEESSCPALPPEIEEELRQSAVRLTLAAEYRSAGTVEFLFNPATRSVSFLEVNARLQVEHPVTEATTGVDVVKTQLLIASGSPLGASPPTPHGHAIEARLCAEDPSNAFAPSAGVIERLRLPGGPGIRVDSGVAEGDAIPSEFDSMIAKIVAWGEDRSEAVARLTRALEETQVVIHDGITNRAFLVALLEHPDFRAGAVDAGWLERIDLRDTSAQASGTPVALLAAAATAYEDDMVVDRAHFFASAARGRPELTSGAGKQIDLRHKGLEYRFHVYRPGPRHYRLASEGGEFEIRVLDMGGGYEQRILVGEEWHRVNVAKQSGDYLVEADGSSDRIARRDGSVVRAPSPAIVSAVLVQPGQHVTAGAPVVVLEAMKSITELVAPVDGIVMKVDVGPNVQVEASAPLVHIEPSDAHPDEGGRRIAFDGIVAHDAPAHDARCLDNLRVVRQAVMGFDVEAKGLEKFIDERDADCRRKPERAAAIHDIEREILEIFTDISALSRGKLEVSDEAGEESRGQQEHLLAYLRSIDTEARGLPPAFVSDLKRTLGHYGVRSLKRTVEIEDAIYAICRSQHNVDMQLPAIMSILERMIEESPPDDQRDDGLEAVLGRMVTVTQRRYPAVADLAHELKYRRFDQKVFDQSRARVYLNVEAQLAYLAAHPGADDRVRRMEELVSCPQPLQKLLTMRSQAAGHQAQGLMLEAITRRYYRIRPLRGFTTFKCAGRIFGEALYVENGRPTRVVSGFGSYDALEATAGCLRQALLTLPETGDQMVDLYVWNRGQLEDASTAVPKLADLLSHAGFPSRATRVLVAISGPGEGLGISSTQHFTFRRTPEGAYLEDLFYRGLHPMMAERLQMWRLKNFRTERLPSVEDVYLFRGVAYDNPKDERLFAIAEVRDLTPLRDPSGGIEQLPYLEHMFMEALAAIRRQQSRKPASAQLQGNRVMLYIWPPAALRLEELHPIVNRLAAASDGLGLEKTVVQVRLRDSATGEFKDTEIQFSSTPASGVAVMRRQNPTTIPIQPLSEYRQRVAQLKRRGLIYPYELIAMFTAGGDHFFKGRFEEHDLEGDRLVAVTRPPGRNNANVVVGVITNFTPKFPDGIRRVVVLGDPSRSLGSLAEPECRRIIAALDLAQEMGVPLEWFAVSSGARISMDSGTENMDWIAAVLRRLIEFTQGGGEVNIIVNGINVGAQPYWNAEATMLMHTRGILIMTPDGSMVLTGKQALDYSGGVSADDNFGIGGYERVMGPNGQAQYWAPDLEAACAILLRHYDHTYRAHGERFPRPAVTIDDRDRDVCDYPYPAGAAGAEFKTVGDIFSSETNPERKNPFDIRTVMSATVDRDMAPLERWLGMRDAETTVVWDAHLGGYPVCLIGIESKPLTRRGAIPADGPQHWTAGTLFPLSSKKVARAINGASDNRPVVVLANLSGFDGSPESMRSLQLEFGAEIGRAVVNFKGPIVFCVISRYHGGAFVVFSNRLNENLEIAAVEGSFASVIGGAPAAGVVFAGEVERRTRQDTRVVELDQSIATAGADDKGALRARLATLLPEVRSEKLGEMAAEFDSVHNVHRAQQVGSIHHIIPASSLRPYLIDAVERGMRREMAELAGVAHA